MPFDPTSQSSERQERFLALLNPVYSRLERFCFAMESDRDQAYDLIGDTVMRAWEHFDRLRDREAFLSWLFTTASRLHRRRRRRRSLFGNYDEGYAAELRALSTPPDESADVAALYAALAQLPHREREAILLFEIDGMTLKEVREIQGGTLSALKVRLHRGRKRLGEILGVEPVGRRGLETEESEGREQENTSVSVIL